MSGTNGHVTLAEPRAHELPRPAVLPIVSSMPRAGATDLRVQPQHLDSEEYIVAGSTLDGEARATARRLVDPSQFYSDVWAGIFRLICRLDDDGRLTGDNNQNSNTILTAIDDSGICEQMTGGINEMVGAWVLFPHFKYVDYHANRVVKTAIQREVIRRLEFATRAAWDGESADEIAERMISTADEIRERLKAGTFRTMTSAELDAADLRTEYLVENVLVAHQPGIIAAIRKTLKTNLSIDLALSIGSAAKFVNHFWIPRPVRVALMSGESGDATIQETARRICWSKPWKNLGDYENCIWSFDLPRLGRPQTKAELIRFIKEHGLEVLLIDPAYLCMDLSEDAANMFVVGRMLRVLTEVMHETGCTIVIIHHCRRNSTEPFAPPQLESIAWAGFQEWARQWILIGRREAYREDNPGSHRLWLVTGGSAGHSGSWGVDVEEGSRSDQHGRRWEVTVDGASKVIAKTIDERDTAKEAQAQEKAAKQLEADAAKLMAEYRKRPDGDTEKAIRERARLSGTRGGAANDKLLADGLIVACQVTKNGRQYDGYRPAGLTGTDRDSTGTNAGGPDGAQSGTTTPIGGSPGPAHRDSEVSLFDGQRESSPDDGGRPA